jgi:hypothetical protein
LRAAGGRAVAPGKIAFNKLSIEKPTDILSPTLFQNNDGTLGPIVSAGWNQITGAAEIP